MTLIITASFISITIIIVIIAIIIIFKSQCNLSANTIIIVTTIATIVTGTEVTTVNNMYYLKKLD